MSNPNHTTSTPRRLLSGLAAGGIVAGMHKAYLYRRFWWYDNTAHLLAGYAIGTALLELSDDPDRRTVCRRFLAITAAWEAFEYLIGEFPWDGRATWDAACEDTTLDTIAGLTGAYLACEHHGLE